MTWCEAFVTKSDILSHCDVEWRKQLLWVTCSDVLLLTLSFRHTQWLSVTHNDFLVRHQGFLFHIDILSHAETFCHLKWHFVNNSDIVSRKQWQRVTSCDIFYVNYVSTNHLQGTDFFSFFFVAFLLQINCSHYSCGWRSVAFYDF